MCVCAYIYIHIYIFILFLQEWLVNISVTYLICFALVLNLQHGAYLQHILSQTGMKSAAYTVEKVQQ